MKKLLPIFVLALLPFSSLLYAQALPHNFQPNTPAKAEEVNDNFQLLLRHIHLLRSDVADLKTNLAHANATVSDLQTKLLEAKNKIAKLEDESLASHVSIKTVDGYATVWVESANLQVVNGRNATNGYQTEPSDKKGITNGLGNIIIGYNESLGVDNLACSDGDIVLPPDDPSTNIPEDALACHQGGGTWEEYQRTGSHNLVIGPNHNYTSHGGLVTGVANTINNPWSGVLAGQSNIASGSYSVVTGGLKNNALGVRSSVTGGRENTAEGYDSSVSGGRENVAVSSYSSISGGKSNTASGSFSSVSGGRARDASASYSWRAGSLLESN